MFKSKFDSDCIPDDSMTATTASSSCAFTGGDYNDESVVLRRTPFSETSLRPPRSKHEERRARGIILLDSRCKSLTITWPPVPNAKYYSVEVTCCCSTTNNNNVRRKVHVTEPHATITRLAPNQDYWCWVTPILHDKRRATILTQQHAFRTLSTEKSLPKPRVVLENGTTPFVTWKKGLGAVDLEVREYAGGADWKKIGVCIETTSTKIAALKPGMAYQFRLRSNTYNNNNSMVSPPSKPILLHEGKLAKSIQRRFGMTT